MAKALTCDICGQYYDYYKDRHYGALQDSIKQPFCPNTLSLEVRSSIKDGILNYVRYDYCKKCMDKIVMFIVDGSSNKEEEEE